MLATALCGGCGTFADQLTGTTNSPTEAKPIISVGQPFDEAKALLAEAGAKDITHAIGVLVYGTEGQPNPELYWFRLRDGKWLSVWVVEVGESKQRVIDNLILGDKKTADHIKEQGLLSYPKIARLELR